MFGLELSKLFSVIFPQYIRLYTKITYLCNKKLSASGGLWHEAPDQFKALLFTCKTCSWIV